MKLSLFALKRSTQRGFAGPTMRAFVDSIASRPGATESKTPFLPEDYRQERWREGDEGPQAVVCVSPPAVEDSAVGVTNAQGLPLAGFGFQIADSESLNTDAAGVKSKPRAQRFERAFLCAPKQSRKLRPLRLGRLSNQGLLLSCEIIGDESVAT